MKKSKFIKNVFLGEDQIIISDSRGKPKKINLSELSATILPPSGQETDPVWTSEKSSYYTKAQSDSIFQTIIPFDTGFGAFILER
jgi:hypothetical protein